MHKEKNLKLSLNFHDCDGVHLTNVAKDKFENFKKAYCTTRKVGDKDNSEVSMPKECINATVAATLSSSECRMERSVAFSWQTGKPVSAAEQSPSPGGRLPWQRCGRDLLDLGFDPAFSDARYLAALETTVVGPLQHDIPWTDYQQNEDWKMEGWDHKLSPTVMLNRMRGDYYNWEKVKEAKANKNKNKSDKKQDKDLSTTTSTALGGASVILSRFAGVGSQRYPVGFTGDQTHSWKGLAYLPYFTLTASNVGFGYWSHDIYGGTNNELANDWELGTRWLQFGAFSPILRVHDKGEAVGGC